MKMKGRPIEVVDKQIHPTKATNNFPIGTYFNTLFYNEKKIVSAYVI